MYDAAGVDSRPNFYYMTFPGSLLDQFAAKRGYRRVPLQLDEDNTTAGTAQRADESGQPVCFGPGRRGFASLDRRGVLCRRKRSIRRGGLASFFHVQGWKAAIK